MKTGGASHTLNTALPNPTLPTTGQLGSLGWVGQPVAMQVGVGGPVGMPTPFMGPGALAAAQMAAPGGLNMWANNNVANVGGWGGVSNNLVS